MAGWEFSISPRSLYDLVQTDGPFAPGGTHDPVAFREALKTIEGAAGQPVVQGSNHPVPVTILPELGQTRTGDPAR